MPSPTEGFQLSALPQAAPWPTNIGKFDPMQPVANAEAQMGFIQALNTMGSKTQAEIAQNRAQTAKSGAEAAQAANTQTGAGLQSQVLAGGGPSMVKSGVLGAQNALTQEQGTALANQAQISLRSRAQSEYPSMVQETAAANALPDYNQKAAALAQVQVKYPWLGLYPTEVQAIETSRKDAEAKALENIKGPFTVQASAARGTGAAEINSKERNTPAVTRLLAARQAAEQNGASEEELKVYDDAITKANTIKPGPQTDAQRIEALENAAKEAETDDPELAKALRGRITKLNTVAGKSSAITPEDLAKLNTILGAGVAPANPASPAAGSAPQASKFVPGQAYTDKNGVTAVYQADGTWKPQ